MTGLMNILALIDGGSFWMPPQRSTVAGNVDWAYYFVYWVCVFFLVLVTAVLVYLAVRYRHREGVKNDPSAGHSTSLELAWTILPTLLVLYIFKVGFDGYMDMAIEPQSADYKPYHVNASKWKWSF